MRCIKCLIAMYSALILTTIAGIVACTTIKSKGYVFDISKYDQIKGLTKDSLDNLFSQGVTVKEYNGHIYYVQNTTDQELKCNLDSIIDFGPVTINRERSQNFNDFCVLDIVNQDNGRSDVKLSMKLTSKFNTKITKIVFEPAWVSYSTTKGLCGVNILKKFTMEFEGGLNPNDEFLVVIPWNCFTYLIQGDPIMISIKLDCYFDGAGEEYFTEVINLNVDNHRN